MFNQNPNFYFDEMEKTGNKIRVKNKLKAKNYMLLATNFIDEEVLGNIQKVFTSLSPEDLQSFKDYLNSRKYLQGRYNNSKEQKILNKVTSIALFSTPKDEFLKSILAKYMGNLNEIDALKIKTTQTFDGLEVSKLIEQIAELNEENCQLIEKINQYRDSKRK